MLAEKGACVGMEQHEKGMKMEEESFAGELEVWARRCGLGLWRPGVAAVLVIAHAC